MISFSKFYIFSRMYQLGAESHNKRHLQQYEKYSQFLLDMYLLSSNINNINKLSEKEKQRTSVTQQ